MLSILIEDILKLISVLHTEIQNISKGRWKITILNHNYFEEGIKVGLFNNGLSEEKELFQLGWTSLRDGLYPYCTHEWEGTSEGVIKSKEDMEDFLRYYIQNSPLMNSVDNRFCDAGKYFI